MRKKELKYRPKTGWAITHCGWIFVDRIFKTRREAKNEAHEWNEVIKVTIAPTDKKLTK